MDKYLDIIANLLSLNDEYEWLDFKENWFDKDAIGEYISAVANGACLCGKEYGYILWGIKDGSKEVLGTTINFDKDINHEPYKQLNHFFFVPLLKLFSYLIYNHISHHLIFQQI